MKLPAHWQACFTAKRITHYGSDMTLSSHDRKTFSSANNNTN